MEVLEIKPIKNKEIVGYIIKVSMNEIYENEILNIYEYLKDKQFNFATIDSQENSKEFNKTELAKLLRKLSIQYSLVDIPEYAKGFLFEEILEKEEQISTLVAEYESMKDKDSLKGQNLNSWIEVLTDEVKQKKKVLNLKLRPQWIVKKILDIAKTHPEEELNFIHFAEEAIFSEMVEILKEFNVKVIIFNNNNRKINVSNQTVIIEKEEM